MELGIVLKGPLSLPRWFLLRSESQNTKGVNLLGKHSKPEASLSCIPTYLAHCQHQPEVSPLGVVIMGLALVRNKCFGLYILTLTGSIKAQLIVINTLFNIIGSLGNYIFINISY